MLFSDPLGLVDEMTLTYFYQFLNNAGEHQKFGITSNISTRYSKAELGGGELNILAKGPRKDMLALEREFHKNLPLGPKEGQCQYKISQNRAGIKGETAGKISLWKGGLGQFSGVLSILLDLPGIYEAARISEETGADPWQIMLQMRGYGYNSGGT